MKYHIKPLGIIKTQSFCQDIYGYDMALHLKGLRGHFRDMA